MKIDWNTVIDNFMLILSIALAGALILTAGWFIGSASAHDTRVKNEYQMACVDKGGNVIYVAEVGKVCTKD